MSPHCDASPQSICVTCPQSVCASFFPLYLSHLSFHLLCHPGFCVTLTQHDRRRDRDRWHSARSSLGSQPQPQVSVSVSVHGQLSDGHDGQSWCQLGVENGDASLVKG
ncbi:uncharacterized protein YALI1_C19181g [Yarrowia lipolytica]|uniref:Uncharacterized protein n=1 Tax=Yarrowia lipolytica TaxID=4952 RepID=A0A1D8NB17_YARLL|nr:hypothetical protein YALI1_C19181g [Yarrowia lipolytica]